MRVINVKKLRKFCIKHRDVTGQVEAWLEDANRATWPTHAFFRDSYSNARPIKNNRVIFNLKGGAYRLIVRIDYQNGLVDVRFIGTHAEYDKIDKENI